MCKSFILLVYIEWRTIELNPNISDTFPCAAFMVESERIRHDVEGFTPKAAHDAPHTERELALRQDVHCITKSDKHGALPDELWLKIIP